MPAKTRAVRKSATPIRMKIKLQGSAPAIWRRIVVPSDLPLDYLHYVIQIAMGWTNSHLHHFIVGPRKTAVYYGMPDPNDWAGTLDEEDYTVADLLKDSVKKFMYEYDFGDSWMHEIAVEKTRATDAALELPVCLAGENPCPPEDCGGIWGYFRLQEILAKPKHPEHREMKEWAGDLLEQEFDLAIVNRGLKRLMSSAKP